MLSVDEAFARLMRLFAPVGTEVVPLAEAGGRVLAQDAVAARDQPPFPASAMDGYAIRDADDETGHRLRVAGVSSAGARFGGTVGAGEAVRIFTGAQVPDGADRILIQEDAEADGDTVVLRPDRDAARHIRPRGADFAAGHVLAAPRRLVPGEIALLAAMNLARVTVARRPVVALVPTGDELVAPGEPLGPDQIVSSNNFGLKALLEARGAEARLLPIARDTEASVLAVLEMCGDADLIVTLGGASVGHFDLVQKTALDHGLTLDFYKVAMRPGKPLMAGRFRGTPLVGLPGNPVSAMVCGQLFLQPAVDVMLGLSAAMPERRPARLGVALGPNGPREHYMRARVEAAADGWVCHPEARQDSSLLTVLASANALMVRAPRDPAREIGEAVEFVWL